LSFLKTAPQVNIAHDESASCPSSLRRYKHGGELTHILCVLLLFFNFLQPASYFKVIPSAIFVLLVSSNAGPIPPQSQGDAMRGFKECNVTDDELKLFPLAALSALIYVLSLHLDSQPPDHAEKLASTPIFHENQLKIRMAKLVVKSS